MSSPLRQLGRNGPMVNAIGFGGMSIGGTYGPAGTDDERFGLLDYALEIGQTFWDTADIYADSEEVMGKWFAKTGKRNDVFLATKFGIKIRPDGIHLDSSPQYVKEACEKSLKRLQTDAIDLYYCHRVDGKTPIEKTIQAMVELKEQGKIRHLGLSEVSSATLRRAYAVHPIAALQIEYSPFHFDIEDPKNGLLQTCRELGVAVVAYSPMGRGLLTGIKTWEDVATDPFLSTVPMFSKDNFPNILKLADKIKAVATRKGCTAAQLTLAWVLAQGDDFIPIPGTRRTKYLEQNFAAQEISLSREEEAEIREAIRATELTGERYPDMGTTFTYGDTPSQ